MAISSMTCRYRTYYKYSYVIRGPLLVGFRGSGVWGSGV